MTSLTSRREAHHPSLPQIAFGKCECRLGVVSPTRPAAVTAHDLVDASICTCELQSMTAPGYGQVSDSP